VDTTHLRSCLTILDSSRRPLSKNVRHDLVRPWRPELEAEMSVINLAQKRSFPPLCTGYTKQEDFRAGASVYNQTVMFISETMHVC
jgi:hypothetical protein